MVSAVILVAGVFGMITVAYINTPLPTVTQSDATAQGSVIYYRDGKSVIGRVGQERVIVDIGKIPQHVQDAAIAAENRTFMEDSGISFSGLMRSVWMTATGQQIQGASTITQQMARNYYDGLSKEVSMQRKVKEIFVAIKLNKTLSKKEILAQYLNTIYYGRGAYGIEAASRAFFDKHVWQLNAAQAAYLAGRIQNPSEFDKLEAAKNFAATQERFAYVIDGMALLNPKEYGQLPAKYGVQAGKLVDPKKFPKPVADNNKNVLGGLRGYMIIQVMEELKQRGLMPDAVRSGGYKIISTFDKQLMLAAKKAVQTTTASMSKEFHTGLAAVDPRNGQVVAFYGGNDYVKDNWNEPFDSRKQAASAFKPYVLAAWLEAGYSLSSYLPGTKTVPDPLPGTTKITNGHKVPAAINVTYATAHSINTAFASMAFALPNKLDDVRSIAEAAGISKQAIDEDENGANGASGHGYQLTIGSVGVTPVEQAAGYSIFANQGKHIDYHVVKEVRQGKDVVMPELKSVKQVISPESAADSVAAMEQVLTNGTAAGQGIGRPAAGKTGTNNDQEDAWFVGFTPQLSTAVGMYREQCKTKKGKVIQPKYSNCDPKLSSPVEVSLGFDGAGAPTRIWHDFMIAAHANQPVAQFPAKAGIGTPENIVPSPTPTPSPTDIFPTDFPTGGPGCLPGDITCDNGDDPGIIGNDDEDPFDEGDGDEDPFGNQSPALPPPPATSRGRRSSRPRRSDRMGL